jgi:hypothetical protein
MKDEEKSIRRAVTMNMLHDFYPDSIESEILRRGVVPEAFDFQIEVGISFGRSTVTTRRSVLYSAVRAAFADQSSKSDFTDDQNNTWTIEITDIGKGEYAVSNGQQRMLLPPLWMLLPTKKLRLSAFQENVERYNLPSHDCDRLRELTIKGSLKDDDVDKFLSVFENTPIKSQSRIESEIDNGSSDINSLVPPNPDYYYQLVGEPKMGVPLKEYIDDVLQPHISRLIKWSAVDGFSLALLCGSHAWVTNAISVNHLTNEQLKATYNEISTNGDFISQLGAIEVGISLIDKFPDIKSDVVKMLTKIRTDDPLNKNSDFNLLSSLVTLVDGELSRQRIFVNEPPYWRRLASIAQASLLHRCINRGTVSKAHFSKWAWENRSHNFYFQNLADMRLEPRWKPDFIEPGQMKSEFIGRLLGLAHRHKGKQLDKDIYSLISDFSSSELQSYAQSPSPFMPGPLEGASGISHELPREIAEIIDNALASDEVSLKSFVALVNAANLFQLDETYSEKAVLALRRSNHYLRRSDLNSVSSLLIGLATLAAINRSTELANDVRILIRRLIHAGSKEIEPDEVLRISIISAAAHEDLEGWCVYLGSCVSEIAFSQLERAEAERIYSHLSCLLTIVPQLWATASNAERALKSTLS